MLKVLLKILLVVTVIFLLTQLPELGKKIDPSYGLGGLVSVVAETEISLPIKILIVPGHDDEDFGALFGNTKEADMNLALATKIFSILKEDKRFEVHITRDKNGYTQEFADYFVSNQDAIYAFKQNAKKEMQVKIKNGSFVQKDNTPHSGVSEDVSIRLYGFNKWANENKVDAVVHVHFNDYYRKNKWTIGKLKGFAIYVPEEQMVNSKESFNLAQSIFTQLKKKYSVSNYGEESGGIVPDQKLIALGANNSLISSVRSVLVEYGYIYEMKFSKKTTREQAYKDMAQYTAIGIEDYFFQK